MTISELRRAIAERLGEDFDLGLSITKKRVTLTLHVVGGTVTETSSDDWEAGVHTHSRNTRSGMAQYIVTVYGTDDWEYAAGHLLTLIDDVSGLVVS